MSGRRRVGLSQLNDQNKVNSGDPATRRQNQVHGTGRVRDLTGKDGFHLERSSKVGLESWTVEMWGLTQHFLFRYGALEFNVSNVEL